MILHRKSLQPTSGKHNILCCQSNFFSGIMKLTSKQPHEIKGNRHIKIHIIVVESNGKDFWIRPRVLYRFAWVYKKSPHSSWNWNTYQILPFTVSIQQHTMIDGQGTTTAKQAWLWVHKEHYKLHFNRALYL